MINYFNLQRFKKKGQGLSLNFIVMGAIALLVLIIIIVLIGRNTQIFTTSSTQYCKCEWVKGEDVKCGAQTNLAVRKLDKNCGTKKAGEIVSCCVPIDNIVK